MKHNDAPAPVAKTLVAMANEYLKRVEAEKQVKLGESANGVM